MTIRRRDILMGLGAAGTAASLATMVRTVPAAAAPGVDVLVIGAGVFGAWTAAALHRAGVSVGLVEAVSPAHSRASSGGESRVTRCGYGDAGLYTDWAYSSLDDWRALSARSPLPLFHETGVLWLSRPGDPFLQATLAGLTKRGIAHDLLDADTLRPMIPHMTLANDDVALLEPRGGALMARRSIQTLVRDLVDGGVPLITARIKPVTGDDSGRLPAVVTENGDRLSADRFVLACGPWLAEVAPDAMADRLFVTRQDVFYFAVPAGDPSYAAGGMPVWADLPFYGMPDIEGRGFKVASDTHGPAIDPDRADRRPSAQKLAEARDFLHRRFPTLASAPLIESRVCQYENTSSGDLLVDRHPFYDNVWLAGGGSGHGFKHGPALGRFTADLVMGRRTRTEPRLSLATKSRIQDRAVQ